LIQINSCKSQVGELSEASFLVQIERIIRMRVLKLDRYQADAALRALGFNLEKDGVAKITGDMTIRATHASDTDCLLLEIKLPNGHLLDCKTSCAVLVDND
jgi:hypothetical protein